RFLDIFSAYPAVKHAQIPATYYSRGFSLGDRGDASRVVPAAGLALHSVTSFLAARDYVAVASRRALWWYQRAMAWWRRRRADQRSANARRVRVISPLAACWARRVSRAVSAMDSLMRPGRGGHGWPPRTGTGVSPRGISSSASS